MFKIITLSIGLVLAGCANFSSDFTNATNTRTAHCKVSGYGWFGAPYAASRYHDCVKLMELRGFKEVEK